MTKKERERVIFEAFINTEPIYAGEHVTYEQCAKAPPDFICDNNKNRKIGIELVEWLHKDQTERSRALEDLERMIRSETFDNTIKDFLKNYAVSIFPVSDKFPSKFGRSRFITELIDILNKFILAPQSHKNREWLNNFAHHPILKEFITGISIFSTKFPLGIEFVKGGAYSPEDARNALLERLDNKINFINYKNLKENSMLNELYLVIYYSMALIYNSPFNGMEQDIYSIVDFTRNKLLRNHGPFDKIILFYALEPNRKVFALWP
jgi:hypothetical protein